MYATEVDPELANLREVFEVLSGDLNSCFEPLQQCLDSPDENGEYAFDGSTARTYVSVAFACIASISTCVREWAMAQLQRQGDSNYLDELDAVPTDEQKLTPLEKAVRMCFGLLDRVFNVESAWQPNEQWLMSFRRAIEVKYRISSPATAAELAITAEELMTVVDAEAGFRLMLASYLEEPVEMPQIQLLAE